MKLLRLFGVSLLLIFAPISVQARQAAPTPSAGTVVSEFSTAAQTLGVVSVVAIVSVLILLVAVGALFVGIYRLGKPLIDNIATANSRADSAAAELIRTTDANRVAEMRKVEIQAQTAETQRQTVTILSTFETKDDAGLGRKSAIENINQHTDDSRTDINKHMDEKIDPVEGKLGDVIRTLEDLRKTAITQEAFDGTINPLVLKIDEALRKWSSTLASLPPALTKDDSVLAEAESIAQPTAVE